MSKELAAKTESLPVSNASISIIEVIERAAMNPDVDIDKMERLLAMKERMDDKASEAMFNQAMSKCQSEMGRISADSNNPQTRSKYASYAALDRVVRPIYTNNGFSLSFGTDQSPVENCIRVICYVSHVGGYSRTYHTDMDASGKGAKGGDVMTKTHASGSAMSYGMRYLLKLIFNIAIGENDDDGNGAGVQIISTEQANEIHAMITDHGINMERFLGWLKSDLKCNSIESINLNGYGVVIARLNSAIKAKAAK